MNESTAPVLPPFGRRSIAVAAALLSLALGLSIGVAVIVRHGEPFAIDQAWLDVLLGVRNPAGEGFGLFMNSAGGAIIGTYVIPVLILLALLWRRKRWSAVYFLASALGATIVVQIIKNVVGRPRPGANLVNADFGSFPSGHTSHAAVLAIVAFVFLPRLWVAIAGSSWVILMGFSRNYVGAHWLSDTVAGALLGAAVAILVLLPLAGRVAREWNHGSGAEPPRRLRPAATA